MNVELLVNLKITSLMLKRGERGEGRARGGLGDGSEGRGGMRGRGVGEERRGVRWGLTKREAGWPVLWGNIWLGLFFFKIKALSDASNSGGTYVLSDVG